MLVNLRKLQHLTLKETTDLLHKVLLHQADEILGVWVPADVDATLMLKSAFQSEGDETLREQFSQAVYALMVKTDEMLRARPDEVSAEFLERLLILLQDLALVPDKELLIKWAWMQSLRSKESKHCNLHLLVVRSALKLGVTIPEEILEGDIQESRFAATAVQAFMCMSVKKGAGAFSQWFEHAGDKAPRNTMVSMEAAMHNFQWRYGPHSVQAAFAAILEKKPNARLRLFLINTDVRV